MVPTGRVVLAGCGPLLWLLAWQISRRAPQIAAILDTTPRGELAAARCRTCRPSCARRYSRKGLALMRDVRRKVQGDRAASRRSRPRATDGREASSTVTGRRGGARLRRRHAAAAPGRRAQRQPRQRGRLRASLGRCAALLDAGDGRLGPRRSPGIAIAGDGAGIARRRVRRASGPAGGAGRAARAWARSTRAGATRDAARTGPRWPLAARPALPRRALPPGAGVPRARRTTPSSAAARR